MKLFRRGIVSALVLGLAVAANAGEKGKKACDGDIAACLQAKHAKLQKRGWLGIEMDRDETTGKVSIRNVVSGSPAEKAGFQKGDVILAVNGVEYDKEKNKQALEAVFGAMAPEQKLTYTVDRGGAQHDLAATLAPIPESVVAQWLGSYAVEMLKEREQVAQLTP
jgi:S1-C subfamily serine protease